MANKTQRELEFVVSAKDTGAARVFKGIEDSVKNLKRGLGEDSTIGGIAKALSGQGGTSGLSAWGNLLKGGSESLLKLRDDILDTKKSTGQIVEEFAKGIPVIGKFVEAGRNIRELITGDELALKAANAEAEETVGLTARIRDNFIAGGEALAGLKSQLHDIQIERAKLEGNRAQKDLLEFVVGAAGAVGRRADQAHPLIQSVLNPKGATPYSDLMKRRQELQTEISRTFVPAPGPGFVTNDEGVQVYSTTEGNRSEIVLAQKKLRDLRNQKMLIDRELRSRDLAAEPLQAQARTNMRAELSFQVRRFTKPMGDIFDEAVGGVRKYIDDHGKMRSPFKLLDDFKSGVVGGAQDLFTRGRDTALGTFDFATRKNFGLQDQNPLKPERVEKLVKNSDDMLKTLEAMLTELKKPETAGPPLFERR